MKPFKGVLRDWYRDGGVVIGSCAYHQDMRDGLDTDALLNDRIVRDLPMHTSEVLSIDDRGTYSICETRNSVYVLIEPRI